MAGALNLNDVATTINNVLRDLLNEVLSNARGAASPIGKPFDVAAPTFPNYTAWLADLVEAIRNDSDISKDAGFQQLASDAHGELSPFFAPTRDVELQQAELDLQYLAFYSNQLFEIFMGQSAPVRTAAADFLSQNYGI